MTGGEVLIYGERLKSPGSADRIRSIMGVCQQFDVLWPELTGKEHMTIYGMVKVMSRNGLVGRVHNMSVHYDSACIIRNITQAIPMRRAFRRRSCVSRWIACWTA